MIIDILSRFDHAGFSAYLAGGCVRDILRSKRPGDYDIATSATPGETARLFRRTIPTGVKHGTVTILHKGTSVEATTFRRDGAYTDGRRPDSVSFDAGLLDDLKRRDFTVNAMAMDIKGVVTDPFGGRGDLDKGIIRAVGDPAARFSEDALRMLRAVRFSARFGFDIEPRTLAAIHACAPLCAKLSAERVRDELIKILAAKSAAHVELTVNAGLVDAYWLPSRRSHEFKMPRGSLKRHSAEFILSLFCLTLASKGYIDDTGCFLRALRFDNTVIARVSAAISEAVTGVPRDRVYVKRLISRAGLKNARTSCELCDFLTSGRGRVVLWGNIARSGECVSLAALAVNGDDIMRELGVKGKEVGVILGSLLEHVIEQPEANERERLLEIATKMRS